ncbi:MAG: metal ABC transporter substrate-binding protein [Bifidobacteriaceae bacterium]|jgi:zinc transport system substrate-binding protein|nr:metal ABC transporter substrate-binding protein [Bifidobacteriaceae bacterium]
MIIVRVFEIPPRPAAATALALTLAAASLTGCAAPAGSTDPAGAGGPQVVASFYPLQWLAQEIAGAQVPVASLTPAGAEPHDAELELSQVSALGQADLLVTLAGFQAAVDDAVAANPPAQALDLGPIVGLEGDDPHFWLDPTRLALAADPIAEALAEADPPGAAGYRERAEGVRAQLAELDSELAAGLAPFAGAPLVTTHAAFNYFAARYNLVQLAVSGIDPEAEPTPARLAEVKQQIGDLPVATIYFEELASPKTAEAIAGDLGLATGRLDPIETDSGGGYLAAMRSNLAALEAGLVQP